MPVAAKLATLGLLPNIAEHIGDTYDTGLTAAGSDQSGALALSLSVNEVTTVNVGVDDGVILPLIDAAHKEIIIKNNTGSALKVYPNTDQSIDTAAANTAVTLAANTGAVYYPLTSTQWISL